jgi:Fe-S-cluster containining protein
MVKYMIEFNEDKEICKKCGGECCKNMGCFVFPEELPPITISIIRQKILTGFCFDCWEGELDNVSSPLFIRARNKNAPDKIFDASWGGECVFLGPNGCSLSWDRRPSSGRALIPNKNKPGECKSIKGYGKKDECCRAWLPYQSILRQVKSELTEGI